MTFSTLSENHFAGGKNIEKGSSKHDDEHLAELFRKERRGRVTTGVVTVPDDVTVTFDTPYPDTDYTITGLVWEDVNGAEDAVSTMTVKKTTKATTGFTVTLTAAGNLEGILHWATEHD